MVILGVVIGVTATLFIHKFITDYNISTVCYVVDGLCRDKNVGMTELNTLVQKYITELYPELEDDEDLHIIAAEYAEHIRTVAQDIKDARDQSK